MMNKIIEEIKEELTGHIMPFWGNLKDVKWGGYYGFMDYNLRIDRKADKGGILTSRILWFFSNAYLTLGDAKILKEADHAYSFLVNKCIDKEHGGVYWTVSFDGNPVDTMKHTYNQAFAIYALSSYYDASGNKEALEQALKLYRLIENNCRDEYGYLEAFDIEFNEISNEALSENGILAKKTMNTLLHVMEGYTELYRVSQEKCVKESLINILSIFSGHIFNTEKGRQEVFFDEKYNSIIDLYSYGHDIETSWLLNRTLDIIGEKALLEKYLPYCSIMAEKIYETAYDGHSVLNECEKGVNNLHRVWWIQAESVVGFTNAYCNSKDPKYLEAAENVWEYIKDNMIDKRKGSEWYWELDDSGKPYVGRPIVEPWKCPYHNGRMCFEMIKRAEKINK